MSHLPFFFNFPRSSNCWTNSLCQPFSSHVFVNFTPFSTNYRNQKCWIIDLERERYLFLISWERKISHPGFSVSKPIFPLQQLQPAMISPSSNIFKNKFFNVTDFSSYSNNQSWSTFSLKVATRRLEVGDSLR